MEKRLRLNLITLSVSESTVSIIYGDPKDKITATDK